MQERSWYVLFVHKVLYPCTARQWLYHFLVTKNVLGHAVCHLEVNEALLVLHVCTVYIILYTFLSPIMLLGAWLPTALL